MKIWHVYLLDVILDGYFLFYKSFYCAVHSSPVFWLRYVLEEFKVSGLNFKTPNLAQIEKKDNISSVVLYLLHRSW